MKEMSRAKKEKLPLALDDTEASIQAVKYVAKTIGGDSAFAVHLLHVIAPMPPATKGIPRIGKSKNRAKTGRRSHAQT
jgi:hypothetical protein